MRFTWLRFLCLPLRVFERTGVAGHPRLAHDHLAYFDFATNRQHSVDCTVRKHHASPFLGLITETPPSPTRCVRHLNAPWMVGHGRTTQLPPSARAPELTRTQRYSRPNLRLSQRALTKSWQLVPAPLPRPRTARQSVISSSLWISLQTCPVWMLAGVWR